MRDPHCLKCGKHITHFGKGWKFSVVKRHGGYFHEECWAQRVITRKRKVYPPEVRRIWNQKHYQKYKTEISLYRKKVYMNNRESHYRNTRRWALEHPERNRELKRNWVRNKRLEMKTI